MLAQMILLALLCLGHASATYHYQALNSSCIDADYLVPPADGQIYVALPTFYYAKIEVDLRHLDSNATLANVSLFLSINNTDTGANYTERIPLNISTGSFSLFADNNLIINAYFSIEDADENAAISKSYLFSQSVSITIVKANPQGSFLFVVTNQDLISLPYNMISAANANNFDGYFLSQLNTMYSIYSRQSSVQSYSDYWYGLSSVAVPYLPYFSNCQDSGDYLYFSQLIHNASTCQLYGDNATPINDFSFGSTATADTCAITKKCIYDEMPSVTNEYPYWNTLSTEGEVLFSVTAEEWTSNQLTGSFLEGDLVPCQIKTTSGTNSSNMFPLQVALTFGYYQITNSHRKIITCDVQYTLYAASSSNFTYDLVINFAPLNHTQIMLNFGFEWFIYMLVFMMIGSISNFEFIIFWCYHLLVTIRTKWHFNIKIYLRLYKEIIKGAAPAFSIIILLTFAVEVVMNGTFFGKAIFSNYSTFWNSLIMSNVGYFAENNLTSAQSGRMGFSYVVIAGYLMTVMSDYLVGKERKKEQYEDYEIMGRKFKPREWNRGKFLFGTFAYIFMAISFLYFTYSSLFNSYIWYIIAFMQILQMVIEEISYSIFEDQLPCLPLKIALGVLSYLATMGAIDLYYFILGYLVDVGISIIEITYLNQLQQKMTNFVEEKIEEVNKFYVKLLNEEDEEVLKKSPVDENTHYNDEILINEEINDINFLEKEVEEHYNYLDLGDVLEFEEEKIIKQKYIEFLIENNLQSLKKDMKNEKIPKNEEKENELQEFESKKFELIIDCTSGMIQYMVQPVVVFVLWVTYQTSTILSNFTIAESTCILYLLSSIVLAIFFQINIIIIFNVLQLYLNFDYKNLLKKLMDRIDNKTTFWITDEDKINKDLELKLRGVHSYSVSSQMFFHVMLYICCIYQFIIGCTTIISAQFNLFKDPYCLLILVFWIAFLRVAIWLIKKVIHLLDIWGSASLAKERADETEFELASSQGDETNEMLIRRSEMTSSLKFTFKDINHEDPNSRQPGLKIAEAKLVTYCKRLEPEFEVESFRLAYAKKNKDFIKANIEKILPLILKFPSNDVELMGKSNSIRSNELKSESKNCDPLISDFLSSWMKRVEINRSKRQEKGYEHEGELKKCNFCFNSWGLYYGYEGMCLECSRQLFKKKEE